MGLACLSPSASLIARIRRLFRFLPDQPALFVEWEALVGTHACHGRVSHDARLAAMRTYGVSRLLTFKGPDFGRFRGMTIRDPATFAVRANPLPGSSP